MTVCLYVCVPVCVFVCVSMCLYAQVSLRTRLVPPLVCACLCVYVCVCVYSCVCVCTHVWQIRAYIIHVWYMRVCEMTRAWYDTCMIYARAWLDTCMLYVPHVKCVGRDSFICGTCICGTHLWVKGLISMWEMYDIGSTDTCIHMYWRSLLMFFLVFQ